jgi:hypothetical protein
MKIQFLQITLITFFTMLSQISNAQISGKVFRDFDANGLQTAIAPIEPGLKDVTVNAYDVNSMLITVKTDATGTYAITSGTGPYRVEFILPAFYYASNGSVSNTTTQFVAASGVANLGVNHPDDYLTNANVPLFIPILWGNSWPNAVNSVHANETALKMFRENDTGITPVPTNLATLGQIGNTWGIAFHNESKTVFASTFFRKYGGFGPGGQSAIYAVKAGADGNFGTTDDAVSTFIKLDDYFGANSTGANAFGNILRGDSLLVSKVAYGDIEMSADAKTLYAINLHDRKIYKIPINKTADTPAMGSIVASALSIPDASDCTGTFGILRPFGLTINRADNKLYVSATCEGTGNVYVWGYNVSTDTWDSAPIVNYFPLDGIFPNCCWRDWNTTVGYEKPTLAMGLDFDKSGNFLNLTFINRKVYTASETTRNAGNVIRFCFDGTNWNIENGGVSCGVTGFSTTNNQGPGGGEFYDDTSVEGSESSIMGAALQIPGRNTFALTLDDPIGLYTGGVLYANNNDGSQASRYEVLPSIYLYPPPPSVFDGKRNAMGDVEYFAEIQPIEIGNRVFMDTDSNGIQDADEMGLDGVTISLYKVGNPIPTTTITANGGQWYFTNLDAETAYEIKILATNIPSGKQLTKKDATSTGAADLADSDASLVGTDAVIAYKTGSAGQNNHTLDFGFKATCTLSADAVGTDPTCPNNDGAIVLTVNNATGTPSYLWSNGATSKDLTGLSAGAYKVTVTDGVCTATKEVVLEVIPSTIKYSICPGETYKLEISDNTLTGIQWKKDGVDIAGANALTYTAISIGVYTYTSNGLGGCAVGQCCPIELTASTNCCKPLICTGVKVTKK